MSTYLRGCVLALVMTGCLPALAAAQFPVQLVDTTGIPLSLEVADPCRLSTKIFKTFSQITSTQLVTGTASKKIYVCSILLVNAGAENVSLIAGTGTVCATSSVAVIGGTTAATGPNLAANGGFALGNGDAAVAATTVNADNLCLLQSSTSRIAGVLTYVVQ